MPFKVTQKYYGQGSVSAVVDYCIEILEDYYKECDGYDLYIDYFKTEPEANQCKKECEEV